MSEKTYTLPRDLVRVVCPDCADRMEASRIVALKLSADDLGTLFPGDETTIKLFSGFSQGLCNRFGGDEGFFTRCAETMAGKVEDEKGFCASLHKFCIGKWPAEKEHAMDYEGEVHEYSNAIRGLEIFSTGTHNGDQYTEKDLDAMVEAFKELDYSPAIKIGHTKDEPGAPAYGWVRNLRRVGEKLYADLEDMHDSVVDALRKRSYDRVSSEIYFNLKRAGKTFPRALKAIALLGAEVPAVASLVPLHKMQFAADGFEAVAACEQQLEVPENALMDTLAERVAGLVNLIKEYDMAKNTAKVKELNEKVAQLKHDMDAMMKKKGKKHDELMDEDTEYAALSDQVKKLSDEAASLATEDTAADEATQKELAELRAKVAESEARDKQHAEDTKTLTERLAKIEKAERDQRIGERVRACKIPAFRASLQGLYAYATEHADAQVKVYIEKDGKTESQDKALIDVVDEVVGQINAQADRLFKAVALVPQVHRVEVTGDEDAGAEVNARVRTYREQHPEHAKTMKYEEIARVVFAADPDLRARYDEQVKRAN